MQNKQKPSFKITIFEFVIIFDTEETMKTDKEQKQQEIIDNLRKELRAAKQKIRDQEVSKEKFKLKSKTLAKALKEEKKNFKL